MVLALILIGRFAQATILANTARGIATMTASAALAMCVDKIIVKISQVRHLQLLTVAFMVCIPIAL